MAEMSEPVPATPSPAAISWRPYIVLFFGVLAVSTAAIFIRLAQEDGATSLVVSAARLSIASLVLTPVVLRRHRAELRAVSRADLRWALASGLVLALHFATWITSLEYTAVVNSVTLVTTVPLWVALIAPFALGERLDRGALLGLLLAIGGGILVGLSGDAGDPPSGHQPLLGNGLALIGAWMAAIYFVIGRRLRARVSVIPYIWMVYSTAAVALVVVVILSGQAVGGLPPVVYLWLVLLGLVPQLIGHSSYNYALGFLPAAYVSLVALGEPIGSGILAMIFLDEWPVLLQLVGSALILGGIALASRGDRAKEIVEAEVPPAGV